MIPTPLTPQPMHPQQTTKGQDPGALQWVDQFSEEMLQTVQALQRLHVAFNTKFPPRGTS